MPQHAERHTDLDAAMKKLGLAPLDMTKLADNLDRFADWWGGMRGCLGKTETDASALRPGKDKLRVKGIMKAWTGIRDDYKQYKVKVRLRFHLRIDSFDSINYFIDHSTTRLLPICSRDRARISSGFSHFFSSRSCIWGYYCL